MFNAIRKALQGYKTYLVAAGAVITALVAYANGAMTEAQLAAAITTALMASTFAAKIERKS